MGKLDSFFSSSSEKRASSSGPPPPSFEEATRSSSSQQHPPPSPQPAASFQSKFACITLNMMDRIRLINFPSAEVAAVTETTRALWPLGIKDIRTYGQSREIQVKGYPWASSVHGDDNPRILLLCIIEQLFNMGCVLQASIDMSKKDSDKDTFIFRKQDPPPPRCDWICISFDRWDKLKVVGAPPMELSEAIVQAFRPQLREEEITPERLKVRFVGRPWLPTGEETVTTRLMVLNLLEILERFGFTVYASVDMENGHEGSETDVLICHRQKDWVPGAPIWHR